MLERQFVWEIAEIAGIDCKKIQVVVSLANMFPELFLLCIESSAPWPWYSKTWCQLFLGYADETNPQLSCFQNKRKGRFLFWACCFSTTLSFLPSRTVLLGTSVPECCAGWRPTSVPAAQQLGRTRAVELLMCVGVGADRHSGRSKTWKSHCSLLQ